MKTAMKDPFIWLGDQQGREKITFGTGEVGVHYTAMFKANERMVDIHKTIELPNGEKDYFPLIKMRYYAFMRFIITFNKAHKYMLRKFWFSDRINIGKLGHHNLILFPMSINEDKIDLFIENKRKKKLRFKREFPVDILLDMLLYPDQLLESKEQSFWVYSNKKGCLKRQGIIFKHQDDKRERSFYYINDKKFRKYCRTIGVVMYNILKHLDFENKPQVMAYLLSRITSRDQKKLVA